MLRPSLVPLNPETSTSHVEVRVRFDELLDIEVTLTELRAASLRFAYVVRRDGTALTEAMTRHACVDNEGRLRRLDEAMFDVLRLGEA